MPPKKRIAEEGESKEGEASTYRRGRSSAGHYTKEQREGFTKLRRVGEFYEREQKLKNAKERSEEDRVWIMKPINLQGALIDRGFVDNIRWVCFPLSTYRWFKVSTENRLWNDTLKTYVMEQYEAMENKALSTALGMVRSPPPETPEDLRQTFQQLSGMQTEDEMRRKFRAQVYANPNMLGAFSDIFRNQAEKDGLLTIRSNVKNVTVVGVNDGLSEAAENRDIEKRFLFLSKSTFLADIFTPETPTPPTLPNKKPAIEDRDTRKQIIKIIITSKLYKVPVPI